MKTRCLNVAGMALILLISSCVKDVPIASIIGKWKGNKAELAIKPSGSPLYLSYSVDNFDPSVEFKSGGTLVITQDGHNSIGTYVMAGKKVTMNINFNIDEINLSGTYAIKELSVSKLILEIEKGQITKDPGTGSVVSGKLKAELFFER